MSVETKDDFLLWPDSIKKECFGLIAAPAAAVVAGGDVVGAGADAAVAAVVAGGDVVGAGADAAVVAGGKAPVVVAPAAVGVAAAVVAGGAAEEFAAASLKRISTSKGLFFIRTLFLAVSKNRSAETRCTAKYSFFLISHPPTLCLSLSLACNNISILTRTLTHTCTHPPTHTHTRTHPPTHTHMIP